MSSYNNYSLTQFILHTLLSFLIQSIVLSNLFLGFIAKRIYQNNMVGIPYLIEYIVTTRRMYKHQYVAVKHLESTS